MKFGSPPTGLETLLVVLAISQATLARTDVAFHGLLRGGEMSMMHRHLSSEQCSAGEELVRCEYGNRPCDGAGIANCDVYCHDACRDAKIDESDVECVQDRSCYQTTFRNSTVHCHGTSDHNCESAQFFASAVTCERGGYNPSCEYSYFYPCSCREKAGGGGTGGPMCYDSITGKADEFCASTFLGRTCKDWGNPACDDVDASTPALIHKASQCSIGEEIVLCDSSGKYSSRNSANYPIKDCSVYCLSGGSCTGATIDESDVFCDRDRSCHQTTFRNSTVRCGSGMDHNCESAQFFSSAVTCERGGYNPSCEYSYFYPCSCREKADGGGTGGALCYDSITGKADDFCSSTFLGRTCKDWGNPACDDVGVPAPAPIHKASQCSIGEEIVLCDSSGKYSSRNCANYPIKDCSVYCLSGGSCTGATIDESDVFCDRDRSCHQTTFRNSTVRCGSGMDHNCESAQFFSSAVTCERGGYNPSCEYSYFYPCSCREKAGGGGTGGALCYDSITGKADEFCASTFLGRTCKDWGNPACDDVDVSTPAPIHQASKCSIGEEIVLCDSSGKYSSRNCANYPIKDCSVFCSTPESCKNAKIDKSDVECIQDRSCYQTTFRNSTVHCHGTFDHNCESAQFVSSAVTCERGGYNPSCEYAQFRDCSCCEGPKCPPSVPKCYDTITGKADDFCASTFLGRTCKDWGNPICAPPKLEKILDVTESKDVEGGVPIAYQRLLYQNDFEDPSRRLFSSCGGGADIRDDAINILYSEPGYKFNQQDTVEVVHLDGLQRNPDHTEGGNIFENPQGVGGNFAIGMLSEEEDDKLALTLNAKGFSFLNIGLSLAAANLPGCGGPFVYEKNRMYRPKLHVSVFDNPYQYSDFEDWDKKPLDEGNLEGFHVNGMGLSDLPFKLHWSYDTISLDVSSSSNEHVTIVFDLQGEVPYGIFDDLIVIGASSNKV